MDDNTFWTTVWIAGFLTICVGIITIGLNVWHAVELHSALIEKGADPIALACARDSGSTNLAPVCSKVKDGR